VLFLKREVRFEVAVVIEFRLRFAVTISPPPVVVSFMVGLPVVPEDEVKVSSGSSVSVPLNDAAASFIALVRP